jgi:hypothetical protein
LITQLPRQVPITDPKGLMLEVFFQWMLNVTNLSIIEGTGSPEGVIEARTTRLYMNVAGGVGTTLYIKRLNDIGGDRTQGWTLV